MHTFVYYNAIKYFYYVNSEYKQESSVISDDNIIYKEQIEEVNALYCTKTSARNVYKIINSQSMPDLLMRISNLGYGRGSLKEDFSIHLESECLIR